MSDKYLVKLTGKCEYAMVFPGQQRAPHPEAIKKGASPNDRAYAITVECPEEKYKKLRKAGLNAMHQLRYKDDDSTWLTIKGTQYKENTKQGPIVFDDPEVVDADGNALNKADGEIGNGSTVTVEAVLETAGQAKALRLKKVTVLDLIPYVREEPEMLFDDEADASTPKRSNKAATSPSTSPF